MHRRGKASRKLCDLGLLRHEPRSTAATVAAIPVRVLVGGEAVRNLERAFATQIVHTLKVDQRNKLGIVELGRHATFYKDPAILLLVVAFAATAFWAVLVLT